MILRELINHLLDLDMNSEVWLSRDDEGNGFRPVTDISGLDLEDGREEVICLW